MPKKIAYYFRRFFVNGPVIQKLFQTKSDMIPLSWHAPVRKHRCITQLAKVRIDPKPIELTPDVFKMVYKKNVFASSELHVMSRKKGKEIVKI